MDAGYYSSEINIIRDACSLNDICGWYRQGQILWESGNTAETVVLLSRQKPDDTIEIDLDLDELEATSAETKATYQEIKDYVLKEFGLKVSNLYISQSKGNVELKQERTIICQRQKIQKCHSVQKRKKMLSKLP